MTTSLEMSARRAGGHRWSELALFGLLGGWVASAEPAEVKLLLDRHSQHAAWRAQQWWDRIPVLADVDRDALCGPPSQQAGRVLNALTALSDPVARLAGAYRVALPRLWSTYEGHRRMVDPIADSSTVRTLAFVTDDVAADWREGEATLQGVLRAAPGAARLASDTVAALEEALLGSARARR